ncbi:MAG: serine/threonine-protein kinase [Myxococcaceae bacterium]
MFQLLERVSESEATENFRAQNDKGELVWLKRARRELLKDEGFAPLMLADLAAAAELKHPHVLPLLTHGQIDGVPYLVQPMVAGWTLSDLISNARGTPLLPCGAHRAAAIVRPLLEALAAAHAMSPALLHRDLAPDNVMVAEDGRVLLANFGLARARQRAGSAKGLSRAYVSVEQARGQPVDVRSEVFAAGLLLFELTCGRLPAQGTAGEVISHIASYELDAAVAVHKNVDRKVVELLEKALGQAPADRFQTAAAFAEALTPLVPADAEALIGQWAGLIDDEQPTQTAKVAPAGEQVRIPADGPAPVAATAALVTSKTAATPGRAFQPRLLAMAALGIGAVIALALGWTTKGIVLGHPEWPVTTISTTPVGSEIWLDGKQLKEHSPLDLHLEPNSMHEIQVHHSGNFRSQVFRIQNTKRLDIDLVNNEMHEERYVEGPPARKGPTPPVPPTPPAPPAPPTELKSGEPEVAHATSTLPAEVVLDKGFELPMDNVATIAVKKGDRLDQVVPMTLTQWRTGNRGGSTDDFDVFAIWHDGDHLRIASLKEPLLVGADTNLYLAPVSREGGFHGDAMVRHQEQELIVNNLRVPQPRNLFTFEQLQLEQAYCFSLKSEAKVFPPVLGTFLDRTKLVPVTDEGEEILPELDGKADPGPVVLSAGHHTLKHVSTAWFTLPTLENGPEPKVTLRFEVCAEKKAAPVKKKK